MNVNDPDIGLKMINITVKNTAQTVTITVTKLTGKPASVVHEISGKVYKYMEIKGDNINEISIDKVKIQFQVDKSWISSNNINRATIVLNRYKNNNWEKLTTREVSEDNDFVYYEAETPGFSTFVISSLPSCPNPITSCGCSLDSTVGYTLANDISTTSGTCLTITAQNTVLNCNSFTISGNGGGNGVELRNDFNVVKYCNITNFYHGIDVTGTMLNDVIMYNNIYGNGKGIVLLGNSGSNNHVIHDNKIFDNSVYGVLISNSNGNSIYNNFFNNTYNAKDGSKNSWSTGKNSGTNIIGGPYIGGNYWNDYTGSDTDHDGIGDTNLPYNSGGLISNGGDNLPLVGLCTATNGVCESLSNLVITYKLLGGCNCYDYYQSPSTYPYTCNIAKPYCLLPGNPRNTCNTDADCESENMEACIQRGDRKCCILSVPEGFPGCISLFLYPMHATAGQTVTATINCYYSECQGKTVYVGVSQYDILRCWCTVSGAGCSCTFTAPPLYGTMDYHARIDINGNGNPYDPGERADATLTINCDTQGSSCNYQGTDSSNTCCGGGSYYCHSSGVCKFGSGGCPTLFVYDGKDYVKERKSNIHSQEGIDTVDDITLTVKPAVVDGNYLLSLKETTLPEHSYIDNVRLFVTDSEGRKEAELVSAKHSKYGDVTATLEKSDDKRTDTQVFDEIKLKFKVPELKGEAKFIFEIEGYNPAVNILGRGISILGQVGRQGPYKMDIADFNINNLPMIFVCILISMASIVIVFSVFKKTMRSDIT
jgi:PGF-pre-PGF domain-containing protein